MGSLRLRLDPRRRRKGFGAIAVVLFLASVFMLMTQTIGEDAVNLLHSNLSNEFQRRANFCCYAAVQESLYGMDCSTTFNTATGLYQTTWDPATTTPPMVNCTIQGDPLCSYTVNAVNNSFGALSPPGLTYYQDPDGTYVSNGMVYLKVHAVCQPESTLGGRVYTADMVTLGYVGNVYWQHAVLGTHSVAVTNNSLVDSYFSNSSVGYNPLWKSSRGNVVTNGITNAIFFSNNSTINGTYRWGPKGTQASAVNAIDTTCNVTYAPTNSNTLYRIPRFSPPWNPKPANINATVTVAPGATVNLLPGSYQGLFVNPGGTVNMYSSSYNDAASPPTPCSQYFFNTTVNVTGGTIRLQAMSPDPNVAGSVPERASRVEVYVGNSVYLNSGANVNPWTDRNKDRPHRFQMIFVGNGKKGETQNFVVDNSSYWGMALGSGLNFRAQNNSNIYGGIRAFEACVTNSSAVHWDRCIYTNETLAYSPEQPNDIRVGHVGSQLRFGSWVESMTRIRGHVAWTLKGLVVEGWDGDADLSVGLANGS